jgi:hypothetical protein
VRPWPWRDVEFFNLGGEGEARTHDSRTMRTECRSRLSTFESLARVLQLDEAGTDYLLSLGAEK